MWYLVMYTCYGLVCNFNYHMGTYPTESDCVEVLVKEIKVTPNPKEGQTLFCLESDDYEPPQVKPDDWVKF